MQDYIWIQNLVWEFNEVNFVVTGKGNYVAITWFINSSGHLEITLIRLQFGQVIKSIKINHNNLFKILILLKRSNAKSSLNQLQ